MTGFVPEWPRDQVADERLPVVLPATDQAPAAARHYLRRFIGDVSAACEDAALISTSELVANAVLHGKPEITLAVDIRGSQLCVRVHDAGSGSPVARTSLPDVDEPGGRGLYLVNTLVSRWGVVSDASRPGKGVWFVLDLR